MDIREKLDVPTSFLSHLFDCTKTLKLALRKLPNQYFCLSLNLLFSHGLPKFQKHFQGPEISESTVECDQSYYNMFAQ